VPQLLDIVRDSFTPQPENGQIDMVFDIAGWLNPHIVKIKNHIYPHVFRFFLGDDGKAKMFYKNWAQDETWKPEGEPITILPTLPEGVPLLVKPQPKDKALSIDELEGKVKQSSKRMTNAEMDWWKVQY